MGDMMNNGFFFRSLRASVIGGTLLVAAVGPALAQSSPETEIDALIDSSASPAGTLAAARGQADAGDLLGAAATLEGALLAEPSDESADVRRYYITILCRLDDRQRAGVELAKLDGATLSDTGWAEIQQACGALPRPAAIDGNHRPSRLSVELSTGIAYNSDAYGAVANQFDLPGAIDLSDDGLSFTASASIDGHAPLGGNGHVYYGLAAQTNNPISGPGFDYQFGSAWLGYGYQGEAIGASFGGVLRHGRIAGSPYVTEYGGQAELTARVAETGRVALRGEAVKQDYNFALPAYSRDGGRYDLALEYQGRPGTGTSYVVGAAYELKDADTHVLGYRGFRGYLGLRTPIVANGTYAALSAIVRHVNYRNAPLIPDRIETRYFARGAIGVPIGDSGFAIEGAASYTRRNYNAASLIRDYDSVGAELRLIYNFGH
ncbi:hypothetical protein [Sphingomonas alpina]|uniref:DUF560 domain-containing protein n=1 Tax=Sphingomonas alpina TaxID=653931 RepID=A0A7H0LN23_9SPHN|nr:hypothetical protein [Sphingomonas alpina]QNQ11076.1 hypothetical protein H3Z74_07955 [Sphingomonas alpina]